MIVSSRSLALRMLGLNLQNAAPVRLAYICSRTKNYDAVLLAGAQRRDRIGTCILWSRSEGRWLLEVPYVAGAYTNRSIDCAVLVWPRYGKKVVVDAWQPPLTTRGRGLALRARKGPLDECYTVLRFPSQPRRADVVPNDLAAVKTFIGCVRKVWSALPARCLNLFYTVVNDGVGLRRGGEVTDFVALGPGRARKVRAEGRGREFPQCPRDAPHAGGQRALPDVAADLLWR